MDFQKHLKTAWNLTLQYIAPLILMTLVMIIVSVFTFGILWPVTASGYMHSLLLMLKEGREPKIQDIFSQMKLFLPLLGFGIIVGIMVLMGLILLILPGILIMLAISFFCLYMIPLMVDKEMKLLDAIKKSYAMSIHGVIGEHVVVLLLFIGITAIGNSIFIGILFTQPFATIFLLLAYQEKLGAFESTEKTLIDSEQN
jgi:hypothetical protein